MAIEHDAGTGVSRTHRYWRVLRQVVAWALVVGVAWLIWPASLGGATSFVIVSGQSMEPTYEPGDLVIARDVTAMVGDVIVYAPDTLGGAQVVHRIIGGDAQSGWQVQGDNNDFVDPFFPSGDEVRGVVLLHIPNAGVVTAWLLNPLLWAAVILTAMVILVWPSSSKDDDDTDGDEGDGERHQHDSSQGNQDSDAQSQAHMEEVEV